MKRIQTGKERGYIVLSCVRKGLAILISVILLLVSSLHSKVFAYQPELAVQTGHSACVASVSLSTNGSKLASLASETNNEYMWEPSGRRLFALCIGVDNPPASKYGVADAKSFALALETTSKPLFDKTLIFKMIDDDFSTNSVEKTLKTISEYARPDDCFIFYYAGLGVQSYIPREGQSDFFMYRPDITPPADLKELMEKGVRGSSIRAWLSMIRAQRQVIIIDSLSSAEFVKQLGRSANNSGLDKSVLLVGTIGNSPDLPSEGHGELTYCLLKGLSGQADASGGGVITAAELQGFLVGELQNQRRKRGDYSKPPAVMFIGNDFSIANVYDEFNPFSDESASDQIVKTKTLSPSEEHTTSESKSVQGKNYALLVGVSKFQSKNLDLKNTSIDVANVENELKANFDFEVTCITDKDSTLVTANRVSEAIDQINKINFGPNDQLFVMFSTHGILDRKSNDGYLAFADAVTNSAEKIGMIKAADLLDRLNKLKVKHVLICLDVCHGGSFTDTIERTAINSVKTEVIEQRPIMSIKSRSLYEPISKTQLRERNYSLSTRKLISASKDEVVPDGIEGKGSPFAQKIIEALRNYNARDNFLDLNDVFNTVRSVRSAPLVLEFGNDSSGSDFYFFLSERAKAARHERPIEDTELSEYKWLVPPPGNSSGFVDR